MNIFLEDQTMFFFSKKFWNLFLIMMLLFLKLFLFNSLQCIMTQWILASEGNITVNYCQMWALNSNSI